MKLLTKSRFKLGLECPNKLYFTKKPEYADQKQENPFLMALAEGGFQVEAYARLKYPDGIMIQSDYENYDYQAYHDLTQEHLKNENVVLFEAAFLYHGLFVRTDILEKKGHKIYLKEVKAKSWGEDDSFLGRKGGINASWKPYLWDLAFQAYVVQKCYPDYEIISSMILADKTQKASIDGINQLFRIQKGKDMREDIVNLAESYDALGNELTVEINATAIVADIINGEHKNLDSKTFLDCLDLIKTNYLKDSFSHWPVEYSSCKKCEFKTTDKDQHLKSGFEHCYKTMKGWGEKEFTRPNIFDIWDWRYDKLIPQGKFFKDQLTEEDVKIKPESDKISRTERQWIQITKDAASDSTPEVRINGLQAEISKLNYPLHFIDFETSTVALPFYAGRKPYETIAFQFSHHILYEDGSIDHANEYLHAERGVFTNFEFVKQLKKVLSNDNGSIFRYASHENTVLNHIRKQLEESGEADREELIEFILSITYQKIGNKTVHKGERSMIDLCRWIKEYYYNPLTNGSNSIKAYLPASINCSPYLQEKYSQPMGDIKVSSKNFGSDKVWLVKDEDQFLDPYKQLEPVHPELTDIDLDELITEEMEIKDGGAAMIAFAKLQYTDMSETEAENIRKALLKYCELDTLAMVMIYEHLKELSKRKI